MNEIVDFIKEEMEEVGNQLELLRTKKEKAVNLKDDIKIIEVNNEISELKGKMDFIHKLALKINQQVTAGRFS
jgi:hypothetical protein